MRFVILMLAVLIPFMVSAEEPSQPVSVNDIQVIKISARDERAVIKMSGRVLQMIQVGDVIGESGEVVEIAKGRVVIEELTDRGTETVIIRIENGRQKIERIRRVGDEPPQLYTPE